MYQIRIPNNNLTQWLTKLIKPNHISEDILPLSGERLGLKTDPLLSSVILKK
ncbi:hypothetical protein JT359_09025 [Candidatus Poribacteria bacterium]|nr:hypothetical protein [Candidatus Poribacteria bacterium]